MMIRRFLAALFVAGALLASSSSSRAQAPPPPGGAPAGEVAGAATAKDATPGYFAAGFLCVGVIFIVCKSARR